MTGITSIGRERALVNDCYIIVGLRMKRVCHQPYHIDSLCLFEVFIEPLGTFYLDICCCSLSKNLRIFQNIGESAAWDHCGKEFMALNVTWNMTTHPLCSCLNIFRQNHHSEFGNWYYMTGGAAYFIIAWSYGSLVNVAHSTRVQQ